MIVKTQKGQGGSGTLGQRFAAILLSALAVSLVAFASDSPFGDTHFAPGNLVVSRSVYDNNPNNVQVGAILPPNWSPPEYKSLKRFHDPILFSSAGPPVPYETPGRVPSHTPCNHPDR
jgi:hypothetical protein